MSAKVTSTIGNYVPHKKKQIDPQHDSVWDKYFMGIALLSAKRSKITPEVGACVVNNEPRVIGTGYNGMPLNCDDRLIWGPDGVCDNASEKDSYVGYVCHAAMNAIVNMNPKSVKGCTMYVTSFPCNKCAMIIRKSGITRVVCISDEKSNILQADEAVDVDYYADLVTKSTNEKAKRMTEIVSFVTSLIPGTADSEKEIKPFIWEHYFMALAVWSGQIRGDDEKEGVCIVNEDKRIVGLGYVKYFGGHKDHCAMHAPVNAIVNESPTSLKGCTMYVVRYPCSECVRVIVQSGIARVIYLHDEIDKPDTEENVAAKTKNNRLIAEKMFAIAHIDVKSYSTSDNRMKALVVDFKPTGKKSPSAASVSEDESLSTESE